MIIGARKDFFIVAQAGAAVPYGKNEELESKALERNVKILYYFCDKTGKDLLQSVIAEYEAKGRARAELKEVDGRTVMTITMMVEEKPDEKEVIR